MTKRNNLRNTDRVELRLTQISQLAGTTTI